MMRDRNRDHERIRVDERERVRVTADTDDTAPRVRQEARSEHAGAEAGDWQVEVPEALNLARDRVRWGPIWAGLFTALTTIIILSLLGVAIGLTAVDPRAAAQGGPPQGIGIGAAIWGAITAIVAFLLGGWVAGRTAAVFDRKWGALNGALVFLVAVPATLLLAGLGLGSLLGTLGSFAGALNIDPSQIQSAIQGATNQAQQAAAQTQPSDLAQAAQAARTGAWGTLIGLLVGLGASALGGLLGTRRDISLDQATGQVSRQ